MMTASAPVFSKVRTFSSAPEVRQRRLQSRQPPRRMRSDVASCQRWGLNKIAVEPQASPGVYWSSPALGHEVSSTGFGFGFGFGPRPGLFQPRPFLFPLKGKAPILSGLIGRNLVEASQSNLVQWDGSNRAGIEEASML